MEINYKFSEEQDKKFNEWINSHKNAAGKLNGLLSYHIIPNGIGIEIKVILKKYNGEKYELDLTDVETW